MTVTAVIVFRAKPGKGEQLVSLLRSYQSKLTTFAGFRSITLARDEADPDRIVELERWDAAASHRAMVEKVGASGGWDALDALTEGEPEVSYLLELASTGTRA